MREFTFRDISPEDPEIQPVLAGLFAEYSALYGDYFAGHQEQERVEWYLPPQGLFIVLECDGEIIAMGAYKPCDTRTAELKRIWTRRDLRRQGLAVMVLQELERRAQQAGYQRLFLTTGFRQPQAVRLYTAHNYQPQFDLSLDLECYSQPPYDGRLRFIKEFGVSDVARAS